jgi:dienelactone hydrolase
VPAVLRHTDEPELTALFAPKPALYISVTGDWTARFPHDEYPHIRAVYQALESPDRVSSKHFESTHDYSKPMREAMYGWFDRWLGGVVDPPAAIEPEIATERPEALAALDRPPAEHRGHDGIVQYYLKHRTFTEPRLDSPDAWTAYARGFRERLLERIGEQGVQDAAHQATTVAAGEWNGYPVEKVSYSSEIEFTVPALLLRPKSAAQSPAAIVLAPGGKSEVVSQRAPLVRDLLEAGFVVLAPDVRLRGELQFKWDLNSVIWGRPEAGMAAHDTKQAADYLRRRSDVDSQHIVCVGLGDLGVTALLSGVADPGIAAVAATALGATYRAGRDRPLLPRLLLDGDLPQIAALLAPRPLWLNNAEPDGQFDFLRRAYSARQQAAALQILHLPAAEADRAVVKWLLASRTRSN